MKKYWSGFTLVELMMVVAIVGIIASIAYPSYDEYVTRSKRGDAMSALMLASQAMERHRSNPPYSYDVGDDISKVFATQVPVEGGAAYYTLSVTGTDTSYELKATPTGSMSGKKTLTLTNTGARTWGGDSCWPESSSSC